MYTYIFTYRYRNNFSDLDIYSLINFNGDTHTKHKWIKNVVENFMKNESWTKIYQVPFNSINSFYFTENMMLSSNSNYQFNYFLGNKKRFYEEISLWKNHFDF